MDYRFAARIEWENTPPEELIAEQLDATVLMPQQLEGELATISEGEATYVYGVSEPTSVRDILERVKSRAAGLGPVSVYEVYTLDDEAPLAAGVGAGFSDRFEGVVFTPPASLNIGPPRKPCAKCGGVLGHVPCYPCNPCT